MLGQFRVNLIYHLKLIVNLIYLKAIYKIFHVDFSPVARFELREVSIRRCCQGFFNLWNSLQSSLIARCNQFFTRLKIGAGEFF